MNQYTFESYEEYVAAQVKVTSRKLNRFKSTRSFCIPDVVEAIGHIHKFEVLRGVCHGVRKGAEVDLFQQSLGGVWVGTEIHAPCCDGVKILNQDFDVVPDDWKNSIDVIYSNSFDHSRDPEATAAAWISCLSPTGLLYIEWTRWHNSLGKKGNRADCFAGTLQDYRDVIEQSGRVGGVISVCGDDGCRRSIIVAGHK